MRLTVDELIPVFRVPKAILSDQGANLLEQGESYHIPGMAPTGSPALTTRMLLPSKCTFHKKMHCTSTCPEYTLPPVTSQLVTPGMGDLAVDLAVSLSLLIAGRISYGRSKDRECDGLKIVNLAWDAIILNFLMTVCGLSTVREVFTFVWMGFLPLQSCKALLHASLHLQRD